MLTGLIIIAGGLLTALYPPQLPRVVVSLLILTGATLGIRALSRRKLSRHSRHPITELTLRYYAGLCRSFAAM
jgi:hypothetical protein